VSNMLYMSAGQFDVFYNRTMVNLNRTGTPAGANVSAGSIFDVLDREFLCDPPEGCGWKSISPTFFYGGINIGYGNATMNSGCVRIATSNTWPQTDTACDCAGGAGYGQTGDGWFATITFRAISPGTSDIAFWTWGVNGSHPRQVHQYNNWEAYYNYSYPGSPPLLWGGNVTVNVTP